MTASTVITEYLGVGVAASRAVSPNVPTGGAAWYYATDTGVVSVWNGSAWVNVSSTNIKTASLQFLIDGGGSAITTGMKGYIEVPFSCTITRGTLLPDRTGSIVVDLFKCNYSQFDAGSTHPVSGDKITASAPLTISASNKAQDSTLTGWTTALAAGDIIGWNVNSAATIQRVTGSLLVTKT